jgi:hypothetical protein
MALSLGGLRRKIEITLCPTVSRCGSCSTGAPATSATSGGGHSS